MRCTVIFICVALWHFLNTQKPPNNVTCTNLIKMTEYTLQLYNESTNNPTAIQLNRFMRPPLLAQVYGIIDSVRGWASNLDEERLFYRRTINYLRRATLCYILEYIQMSIESVLAYDTCILTSELNAYYEQIRSILSSYSWNMSEIPIIREELVRFRLFSLFVERILEAPYVQLNLREATPIRFIEYCPEHSNISWSRPFSRPIPRSPTLNRNNEVEILLRAQTFVLRWHDDYRENAYVEFHNYMSETSWRSLVSVWQYYVRISTQYMCDTYIDLSMIMLIQLSCEFLFAEFHRYNRHPYHAMHRGEYDATLQQNHRSLCDMYNSLTSRVDVMTSNISSPLFTFYENMHRRAPTHVGYMLNAVVGVALWFEICPRIDHLIQDHYDYENGTTII